MIYQDINVKIACNVDDLEEVTFSTPGFVDPKMRNPIPWRLI